MSTKQTVLLAAAALAASASAIRGLIDDAHAKAIPFTHEKLAEHVADFADDASAFVDALSAMVPDDHPDDAAPAIALTTPGPAL
jgi:hypothetical protein